jgi:hypothetical protein
VMMSSAPLPLHQSDHAQNAHPQNYVHICKMEKRKHS